MDASETRAALTHFYDALARRDGAAMAAMYAADATFEDPVFRLRGPDIGRMWIGLTGRAKNFAVSYSVVEAAADAGSVELTARYLFGGRRPVVNVIRSEIRFGERRIVRHVDRFDFPVWAAQALGLAGRHLRSVRVVPRKRVAPRPREPRPAAPAHIIPAPRRRLSKEMR